MKSQLAGVLRERKDPREEGVCLANVAVSSSNRCRRRSEPLEINSPLLSYQWGTH